MTDQYPGAGAPHDAPTSADSLMPTFIQLADLLYPSESGDYGHIYQRLCVVSSRVVPGCDHASLMVVRDGRPETVAASDDVARMIDDAERRLGEGPCLDAITDDAPQLATDLSAETKWPLLSKWIVENTPVRSSMGFRLVLDGAKIGALNLFSDRVGGLGTHSAGHAAIFAGFAAAAVSSSYERQRADDLAKGLASNREIGKAVGLLMAFHQVDDREAFAILRRTSQDLNIKLADVAQQVIDHQRNR